MNNLTAQYYQSKISECKSDLLEAISELKRTKTHVIITWAECLEQLQLQGHYPKPITSICSHIISECESTGIDINDRFIRQVLPSKYKEQYRIDNALQQQQYHKLSSGDIAAKLSNEELKSVANKTIDRVIELKQELHQLNKYADKMVEACDSKGIVLDKVDYQKSDEQLKLVFKGEESKISTPEDERITESYKAMVELSKTIQDLTIRILKMPPSPELDARLSQAIKAFNLFLTPFQDKKWARSLFGWIKIQEDNINYGKHAAGSRNATITMDGKRRIVTREQVGDRFEDIICICCDILNIDRATITKNADYLKVLKRTRDKGLGVFVLELLEEWHHMSAEPRIASRRFNMHDKLSNLS